MILLIMSRVFLVGACYGFWLNDSMVMKTVGVLLAIGFVLDLIYQTTNLELERPTRHGLNMMSWQRTKTRPLMLSLSMVV